MHNDPRTAGHDAAGPPYTARLLAAFDVHLAAERAERARAGRHTSATATSQPVHPIPSTRPHSPYLRLRQDRRDAAARVLHPKPALAHESSPADVRASRDITDPPLASPRRRTPTSLHRWPPILRPFQHLSPQLMVLLIVGILTLGASVCAYDVYAASLRARPATIQYTDTPLPTVIAELRRRSSLDIRLCNVAPERDRVTITLEDTPIDTILHRIGRQNKLLVHWWWMPHTVLLQPRIEINQEHGLAYNLKVYLLSFTTIGCHP